MVECPYCHTQMPDAARFCPGCGTPRSSVREQLEREAAETGVPYESVLARERDAERQQRIAAGHTWTTIPVPSPAQPEKRNRLWLILGILGGVFLLLCVCCVGAGVLAWQRFDVTVGEDAAGRVARRELELGADGEQGERWDLLHPAYQLEVPRERFIECERTLDIRNIDVVMAFDYEMDVTLVGSREVRFVLYNADGGSSENTQVVPMVQEDGEWYWIMSDADLDEYLAGRCP